MVGRSEVIRRGRVRRLGEDERGAVLILVVFALLGLIAIAALAIDLGVMYNARNESQNVADGSALAGAGILIISPGNEDAARAEAKKFAAMNYVRGQPVTLQDEDIEIFLDEEKVRVWVRHTSDRGNPIGTFFAKVVGIETVDIVTMAAARAWPAGGAECLIPLMLPDKWYEGTGVSCPGSSDGGDCLETFDHLEDEPTSDDDYTPYCANEACTEHNDPYTGWGQDDTGTRMEIKKGNAGGPINSSWYFPWVPVDDEGQLDDPGGAAYRERFTVCDDRVYAYGDQVATEPGAMVGPTNQGIDAIIEQDPDIYWDDNLNTNPAVGHPGCPTRDGVNCTYSSPRIRPMPMFDPTATPVEGRQYFTITNIASVFLDDRVGNDIYAYFLGYGGVAYGASDPDVDTPLKFLRLVE